MVIFPWIIKFVKKNWKKIILTFVGLVAFCFAFRIVIHFITFAYIPVKEIGTVETFETKSWLDYVVDTKEEFSDRLERWEESGYSLEDIETLKEELQRYDENNILIIYSHAPIDYLSYYRDNPHKRVFGSHHIYVEPEQRTKIYVYITKYRKYIYTSQYFEYYEWY